MDGVFYVFILLNYHLPKRTLVTDELKVLHIISQALLI
jgi:hypothetical protein